MLPSAHEDRDLIDRAAAFGLSIARTGQPPPYAIRNPHVDTMKHSGNLSLDGGRCESSTRSDPRKIFD